MDIGIFGSGQDAQCRALAAILEKKGARALIIEANALHSGGEVVFDGRRFFYQGVCLNDLGCVFLRYVLSTLPPAFEREVEYHLFRDWFVDYMHKRERFGFELSSLLTLGLDGVPLVNPPEHGSVLQLKAFQLAAASAVGLAVPDTVITNSPEAVHAFRARHDAVIYKPSMGGGLACLLDEEAMARLPRIQKAPVIFQERIEGVSIRVTMVGERAVSAVRIRSAALDYRATPEYAAGHQEYESVELPSEVLAQCRRLMEKTGLVFSGIDFIEQSDGRLVFLEANSSPIYLDIEMKTQVPITAALADHLLELANPRPAASERRAPATSFVAYALPYRPTSSVGGAARDSSSR